MNKIVLNRILNIKEVDDTNDCQIYFSSIDRIESDCFAMKCHFPYLWLLDINIHEPLVVTENYQIKYSFYDADSCSLFSIHVDFFKNHYAKYHIKSLAHLWRNAFVFEQEISENLNIHFSRDYEKYYQNCLSQDSSFDLSMNLTSRFKINNYKAYLNLNGDEVVACQLERGNFHIGIESAMKNKRFHECITFMELYFPKLSLFTSQLLCGVVEKEHNILVPDRAKALRMVAMELARIFNHLIFLRDICCELSLDLGHKTLGTLSKTVQALLLSYSGNEFSHYFIRIGGVTQDVHQVWVSRTLNELQSLENLLLNLKLNVFDTSINKLKLSFHIVSKEDANLWSLTGPLARATGLNFDLRKNDSFYFYKDIEFDVPIGVQGSGYDLLTIRCEEIFQSVRIISQVLDNIPTGHFICDDLKSLFQEKNVRDDLSEHKYRAAVADFQKVSHLNSSGFLEGPDGIVGCDLIIHDELISRFHYITPSRLNKKIFEMTAIGRSVDELIPFWVSLGINLKEVER